MDFFSPVVHHNLFSIKMGMPESRSNQQSAFDKEIFGQVVNCFHLLKHGNRQSKKCSIHRNYCHASGTNSFAAGKIKENCQILLLKPFISFVL